jgi:CelD/BcsL family acetyltransferase involved in cellulose biosynthesis
MHIEAYSDLKRIAGLEEDWNRAVEASAFDSVFGTHEWFFSWGGAYLGHNSPLVVTARDRGELIGILPLMMEKRILLGSKRIFIRSMTNEHSCKFDFILNARRAPEVLEEMMTFISHNYNWDFMILNHVPADSDSLSILKDLEGKSHYKMHVVADMESPYVELRGSWNDYLCRLDRNFRRNIHQFERRLERAGSVALSCSESPDDPGGCLSAALAIEKMGWKGRAGTAVADSVHHARFYWELADGMSRKGRFALFFLSLNGEKIAFDYCLKYKDRINLLKTSYDPSYAKLAPGKVLRKKSLEGHFREPYRIYDLLGSREEWKTRWTPSAQKLNRVLVFNKKMLSACVYHAMMVGNGCKEQIRRHPPAYRLAKRAFLILKRAMHRGSNGTQSV